MVCTGLHPVSLGMSPQHWLSWLGALCQPRAQLLLGPTWKLCWLFWLWDEKNHFRSSSVSPALLVPSWQPWEGCVRPWQMGSLWPCPLLTWMSCACWNYLLPRSINTIGSGLYFMHTRLYMCWLLYFKSINNTGASAEIKTKQI